MLVFQLFIYPRIVKEIGATRSQRWACFIAIPTFLAYPFLAQLHDSEGALLAASVALLLLTSVASNAVGATPSSIHSRMLLQWSSLYSAGCPLQCL